MNISFSSSNGTQLSNVNHYSPFSMSGSNINQNTVDNQRRAQLGGTNAVTAEQTGAIATTSKEEYLSASKESAKLGKEIANLDRKIERNKNDHWANHNMDPLEVSPWTKKVKTELKEMQAEKKEKEEMKSKHDNLISKYEKSLASQLETQASATQQNVLPRAQELGLGADHVRNPFFNSGTAMSGFNRNFSF